MRSVDARRIFAITDAGVELSERLISVYADAHRASAQMMLPRISKLNAAQLERSLATWLRADPVMFDLLGVDLELTLFEVQQ